MASFPTAPVAAGSLVGGYLVARLTKKRPLGGVALAGGALYCGRRWLQTVGPARTAGLLAAYLGAFGLSHPLAHKVGAWPSVLTAAAASGGASWLVADRRHS